MRFNTCAMLNKLQSICWPDNVAFQVEDIEVVGFYAHSATAFQRLEGMITIVYHRHIPLEAGTGPTDRHTSGHAYGK